MNLEEIVFEIISHAGTARSMCFEALSLAQQGQFPEATDLINQAKDELIETHKIQNSIIQKEANGEKQEISLLLVHAEDHLMTAILAKDLITEMIKMCKENKKYKEGIENV